MPGAAAARPVVMPVLSTAQAASLRGKIGAVEQAVQGFGAGDHGRGRFYTLHQLRVQLVGDLPGAGGEKSGVEKGAWTKGRDSTLHNHLSCKHSVDLETVFFRCMYRTRAVGSQGGWPVSLIATHNILCIEYNAAVSVEGCHLRHGTVLLSWQLNALGLYCRIEVGL